ncbi:DUF418 domain-containing protein [Rhizobium laguerreae]|uniref:DUF418 domain-containing protein n=1 Tax=Rhizobium laguerreae TaxID=1076926 RepID=UPI003CCE59C9
MASNRGRLDVFDGLSMLFGFVVAISTFAVLWLRAFQRGPMEVLMGRITDLARHIL